MKILKNEKGFTLVEFIIYLAIFSTLSFILISIFSNFIHVQNKQTFLSYLTQEFNFVSNVIDRLVKSASLIDQEVGIMTTTLKLRMAQEVKDPTIIYFNKDEEKIYLKEGNNPEVSLISEKVKVKDFRVVKFENSGSRAVVEVYLTLENKTDNPKFRFSQTLQTAIGKISAATFDSSLVPNAPSVYDIGATGYSWRDAYFSGQVGIGTVSPGSKLGIGGGDIVLKDAGRGIILKTPNGNNCYKIFVTDTGALTSTLVSCP